MREMLNVKQTHVYPRGPQPKGGSGKNSWAIFRMPVRPFVNTVKKLLFSSVQGFSNENWCTDGIPGV
jgi:hypothetical protein